MSADSSDASEEEQSPSTIGATDAPPSPPKQRFLIGSQRPGASAADAKAKPVTPAAMTLIFEFLDGKGTVVANQEVQIPALKVGASQPIQASAKGAGIVAWRYKKV